MSRNLNEFLAEYNANEEHPVTEINVTQDDPSPFIIIRHGDKTVIVNPLGLGDHLSVDIHSFVAGEDATAGVFGMSNGKRWALPETGTTSHKWNSANLIAVLVGEQGEKES
jgi:hypothetical protein